MNKVILLSAACAVLGLTACDHYSTRLAAANNNSDDVASISPAAGGEVTNSMTFSQYLASEYYHMARYEQNQRYDFQTAKYYTEKAEALSKGNMVGPANISDYTVAADKVEELNHAREDLIRALTTYNIPENRYHLAMAQTRYDCWLERQEETNPEYDSKTCQNEFRHSMASLVPPDSHEISLIVPFEKGSMVLSEDARISIGRAISFWKNNKEGGYKLKLSPATGVSRKEADRQISMVRSILQYNGIPASEIGTDYVHTAATGAKEFEILVQRQGIAPIKSGDI